MSAFSDFAEFMQEYIEVQPIDKEAPWCMSIDMLVQVYEAFLFKVKNVNGVLFTNFEKNLYNTLKDYIVKHSLNIHILGSFNEHGVPRMTLTGIRLKKVPGAT